MQRPNEPTPDQLFQRAATDKDYSDEACLRSCAPKTVVLFGPERGEDENLRLEKKTGRRCSWRRLFSREKRTSIKAQAKNETLSEAYVDKNGNKPAFATLSVTWVEQGLWKGRKAHFLRLHIGHHHGDGQWIERVELDVRVWKAGDAIQSIAHLSSRPLSSFNPPPALKFAADAPEIVLYGPRLVVGREAGTPVDCLWDGHFQPGDNWTYFAEARTPQHYAFIHPTRENVWSMLRILSFGDYALRQPAQNFDLGLVVLSDGMPFDLTVYSTSIHHQPGSFEVTRHLWSPYSPVKINGTVSLIPKDEKPMAVDFGSNEMKAKWKDVVDWSKPYDTVCSLGSTKATN